MGYRGLFSKDIKGTTFCRLMAVGPWANVSTTWWWCHQNRGQVYSDRVNRGKLPVYFVGISRMYSVGIISLLNRLLSLCQSVILPIRYARWQDILGLCRPKRIIFFVNYLLTTRRIRRRIPKKHQAKRAISEINWFCAPQGR